MELQISDVVTSSLRCAAEVHFPFGIAITRDQGGTIAHGHVRIESIYGWDGGGGRTDLHDILGLCWAASLRASGAASSAVWAVEGWGGVPEINMRLLFFDQPYRCAMPEDEFEPHRKRLLADTAWASHGLSDAVRLLSPRECPPIWKEDIPPSWLHKLDSDLRNINEGIWITRKNPDWEYFMNKDNSVSIVRLSLKSRRVLNWLFCFYDPQAVMTGGNYVVTANGLINSVPVAVVERAVAILRQIEGRAGARWHGPEGRQREDSILMIPLESHCIFFGTRTMVALAEPCDLQQFEHARAKWSRQSAMEASIFNASVQWQWKKRVDPARFEQMVHAILSEEPGLHWVRPAGPTYERDQGRDLVAMWLTPPGLGQKLSQTEADKPIETRKVLIQVKVRKKAVGKGDVRDVRDTLERHNANGFLLVVYPGYSNDLFNY